MTATERVLAHFDRISEAPDAIPLFRRFVLDLAVRGKLVDQDAGDEPASELLERIASQDSLREKHGRRARGTFASPVAAEDEPFGVPESWRWVHFAQIADFSAGRTPSRNDASFWNTGDHAWVSIADMDDGRVLKTTKETVSSKARERVFRSEPEPPGTMLMSFKLTIGKMARLEIPAFHNEAIISIRPHLADLDAYLFKVLPQFARQGDTKGAIKGSTLNRESISNILVPLPPLAEQHRIVAKVDELMAHYDRLEAAEKERESRRDRLVSTSLAPLNQPWDQPSFREHARFHVDHLPRMTRSREHVRQLRRTILDLAVHGKLAEQDPDDESASECLRGIAAERMAMIGRGLIRREKPLEPIDPAEQPFDLPHRWLWSRIGDVVLFTQYGTSQRSSADDAGVPVLAMGNIQDGAVIWTDEKKIPETSADLPALLLDKFDILYNRTNSAELVGKTGIYLGEDGVRTFASYLIRLRPSLARSNPRYLNMAMNAPCFRATQIVPLIKKQTGQANVNGTALRKMLIPLPPRTEQDRIVAKVDELMAACDRLETQLDVVRAAQRALLEGALRGILIGPEATPMIAAG